MAVVAAIEALRATLDLVSETKTGQLLTLLDLCKFLKVFFLKKKILSYEKIH